MAPKAYGRKLLIRQILCIGTLLWAFVPVHAGSGNPPLHLSNQPQVHAGGDTLVSVSYKDLVDTNQITQSGQALKDVLSETDGQRSLGSVQPFLGPFSALLSHVLDICGDPAGRPYVEIERQFPPGSEQPAWVAILRSGTIKMCFDGYEKVRVFLPGNDPQESYQRDYGVIRHALAGLLHNAASSRLTVEVYAYRNDYAIQELRLNLRPYVFVADSFPAPKGRITPDLVGLRAFFQEQGTLEGGAT